MTITIYTFDKFVEYGRAMIGKPDGEMPSSFHFYMEPVTHENDNCYLIGSNPQLRFNRGDLLIHADGDVKILAHAANASELQSAVDQLSKQLLTRHGELVQCKAAMPGLQHTAEAWHAVRDTLDGLAPGWNKGSGTTLAEDAVRAILRLPKGKDPAWQERSNAWYAVCDILGKLVPDWLTWTGATAAETAVNLIEQFVVAWRRVCDVLSAGGDPTQESVNAVVHILQDLQADRRELQKWADKTDWMQEAAPSDRIPVRAIGLHRADVLKNWIEQLEGNLTQLNKQLAESHGHLDGAQRDNAVLRRLLAYRVDPMVYTDDGELNSASVSPFIDFKRDSVEAIEAKLGERGRRAFAQTAEAKGPNAAENEAMKLATMMRDVFKLGKAPDVLKLEKAPVGPAPVGPAPGLQYDTGVFENRTDEPINVCGYMLHPGYWIEVKDGGLKYYGKVRPTLPGTPAKTPLHVEDMITVLEGVDVIRNVPGITQVQQVFEPATVIQRLRGLTQHA